MFKELQDLLTKYGPASDDELERTPAAPEAAPVAPAAPAPARTITPPPPIDLGYDVESAVAPLLETRELDFVAPQIDKSKYTNNNEDLVKRENEFKKSLEDLRNEYRAAQEDARSRELKAEMIAAIGNNIGNIVGGAQAMNTKAAVTPTQTSPVKVKDLTGRADSRFNKDYDALLKQYKGLKDGQLTQKDLLEIDKVNLFAKMGERKINDSVDRTNKSYRGQGVRMIEKSKEQDELTSKQTETLTNIDTTIDSIDTLEGMSKDFHTGPIAGRVEKIKAYVGQNEGARAIMSAQLGGILSSYAKSISGTAVADQEYARLERQLPLETDNPEVFAAKMARFRDELLNSRARVLDSIKRSGRNTKNFEQRATLEQLKGEPTSSAPNGQDVVERNGKTYKWNPSVGKYQLLVK